MRYTVSSGGVVIGETDLGFVRSGLGIRGGWFHPNAEGERLLPRIIPPLLAMRAHVDRDAWCGDHAEVMHHADLHPLTLHDADGAVVPTRMLGIQDMHQLLALAEWDDARREAQSWTPDAHADDALLDALEGETDDDAGELLAGDAPPDDAIDADTGWAPDDEPTDSPRYQIILELVDGRAIP